MVAAVAAMIVLTVSSALGAWTVAAPVQVHSFYPVGPVYAYPAPVYVGPVPTVVARPIWPQSTVVYHSPVVGPGPLGFAPAPVVPARVYYRGRPHRRLIHVVVP
jgi:hypothetical protein